MFMFSSATLSCGVNPRCSSVCTTTTFCVSYNCYADDIQLYTSFSLTNVAKISVIQDCIDAINNWVAAKCLSPTLGRLVLFCVPDSFVPIVINNLVYLWIKWLNLWWTFDDVHLTRLFILININSLVCDCLSRMVSKSELEMIIHGSVSSQLDYFSTLASVSHLWITYRWSKMWLWGYLVGPLSCLIWNQFEI